MTRDPRDLAQRIAEIEAVLDASKAECHVTQGAPGVGGWGWEMQNTTKTFTLHSCKGNCGFYVSKENTECLTCMAKSLVKLCKPLAAEMPRWVPCEERLPEEDGEYLVWVTGWNERRDVRKFAVRPDNKWFSGRSWYTSADSGITHWAALPSPPREEAK